MEVEDSNLKEAFRMRDLTMKTNIVYSEDNFSNIDAYMSYFVLMSDVTMITKNTNLVNVLKLKLNELVSEEYGYRVPIWRHIEELLKPCYSESLLTFTLEFIVPYDEQRYYAVDLIEHFDDFRDIFSRMLKAGVFTAEDIVDKLLEENDWSNLLRKYLYGYNNFDTNELYRILDTEKNYIGAQMDSIRVLEEYLSGVSDNV